MYKIIEYSDDLELDEFYQLAYQKGYYNNANKFVLVDTFKHIDKWKTWFLFYNDRAVGSVTAHSLEELGILGDAYRIAARTCILADLIDQPKNLRTENIIFTQHQHLTAQILIPTCIEWAGRNKDLYISTTENDEGKQKAVHRKYCPSLRKSGVLDDPIELEYRLSIQYFWKINVDVFYSQLSQNWWPEAKSAVENYFERKIEL
jgi:hypothetical protein